MTDRETGEVAVNRSVPTEQSIDPRRRDHQPEAIEKHAPSSEQVTALAFDLTTATLQRHGNQLSPTHREALGQAAGLFTEVASGQRRGRYVLDLPTGLGKTTSIVCWTKAMAASGIGWSLAICAGRVEELCDLHDQLVAEPRVVSFRNGPSGVKSPE